MKKFIHTCGFTLLEVVVVLSVLALLIPTVFSVVYIIVQQQFNTHKLVETKKQGDLIINYMKETIARDAIAIATRDGALRCDTSGSNWNSNRGEFNFTLDAMSNPDMFSFQLTSGSVAFVEQSYVPARRRYRVDSQLNLNDAQKVRISNFFIECLRKDVTAYPLIGFSFDATFVDRTPSPQEDTITLHYQTKLKLRAGKL